ADGHATQDAGAVADPDVVADTHVALVDALEAHRSVDLDDAVVEVDQHHAIGDHALSPDRDVLIGGDRALLAEHCLRTDRHDALVRADLRAVADPRPAPELDARLLSDLDDHPGADECKAVEVDAAAVRGEELATREPHDEARVLQREH